jgi:hypothetical protein
MKSMTCRQLGGACDLSFQAETFEEMAEMSKRHGKEMYFQGDAAHRQAMDEMKELMKSPEARQKWFQEKRKAFEVSPEY